MARTAEKTLKGWMTALVTPFNNGAIDEAAFRALIDWQIASGIHGLVPVGTTGESPTLSHDEHKRVVEIAIAEARGRVPVIAGAGSNNTREAVELAVHAEKAGADAVLVVTPYYNKPNQEGLFQHYRAIDAAIGIPIVIYNIPPRSVIDMSIDTMKRCYGELRNIVGVKDATGNVGRISLQRQALGPDFIQLSGDDITALSCIAAGAVGCISVVSNVVPALCAELMEAAAAGEFAKALAAQDRLVPLDVATFLEAGVTGAKTGLNLLGRASEEVRLPLVPSTDKTREAIRAALVHAGVLPA
jgi:4-hydroxy-tetrahydrodipicolinate synthase